MSMVEVNNRAVLASLFKENRYDTVIMNGVLRGYFGTAVADSATHPAVARLDSGTFTIVGGDPSASATAGLLRYKPIYYVTPEDSEWRRSLRAEFGHRLAALPFTEYLAQSLDESHLKKLIRKLPKDFELVKIGRELAEQLSTDLGNEYFLENFRSTQDFLNRGQGYCILSGDEIVGAATSMAMCDGAIDIEIEVASQFRRKGLGTGVGAQLVLDCLENSIEPKWLAANIESEKLAQRLGYVKGGTYETFEIAQ